MIENPDNESESYLNRIRILYQAVQPRDPQYADSFRRALGTIVTMAERGNSFSFIEESLPRAEPENPLEILRQLIRLGQRALELEEQQPDGHYIIYNTPKRNIALYLKKERY